MLQRILRLRLVGGTPGTIAHVDDAHRASRVAFSDEPRAFQLGAVDIAVFSTDKHVAGPRAGLDGIVASLERGIERVARVVYDAAQARRQLPGDRVGVGGGRRWHTRGPNPPRIRR